MSKIIFSLFIGATSVLAVSAHADDFDLTKCGQGIAYRPGGSSVIEARYAFNAELDILLNSCAVQKKLITTDQNNYYIRSFTHKMGVATLVYDVTTFANPMQPMEMTCTLVQKMSYAPVQLPADGSPVTFSDRMQETVTQTCTDPVPAK